MKKTVSIFLLFALIFTQFGFTAKSVEINNNLAINADTFGYLVREMLTEYDTEGDGIQTYSISENNEFSSCRLIVKSSENIDTSDAVSVISGYKNLWVLQYDSEEKTKSAFEYYNSLPFVEYAEPDTAVEMYSVSSETLDKPRLSWGSEAIGADDALTVVSDINLPEIKVGIIDSGIDYNHEFLKERIIDEGYNFSTSGDSTSMSDDPKSHGTHVAGIIVDNTPENVKIKGYKIFNSSGNSSNVAVVAAVEQAVADGMDIINMSFGGSSSSAVRESLLDAYNKGVTLVAATGNTYKHLGNLLPAALDEVISVTAINSDFQFADFSSYGPSVDLCAPGVDIYSTVNNNSYGNSSGTSMAAPFVSACAAILLSQNTGLLPPDIEEVLVSNAIPINDAAVYCGNGVVNAANLINCERTDTVDCTAESGYFYEPVTVSLPISEYPVYYSLDSSYPDAENGILYESPVTVSESAVFTWMTESKNEFQSKSQSVCVRIIHKESEEEFEISKAGKITAYNGTKTEISIPQTVDSITVTAIGDKVFNADNHPEMRTVIMPETVTKIGLDAFRNNQSIEHIEANGVKEIASNSFRDCTAVTHLGLPSLTDVSVGAFMNCYSLGSVDIQSVKYLGAQAFYGCISLESLLLPNVEYIDINVFVKSGVNHIFCKSLKEINSFPVINNSVVFLPSSAVTIADPQTNINFKIVASKGTVAENWAKSSHSKYKTELIEAPSIAKNLDYVISEGTDKLEVDAIGFELTYQWYGSNDGTIENSVALSGETGNILDIDKDYLGYYCVVTSTDNDVVTSVTTVVSCYPEAFADYSGYEAAKKSVPKDLTIYTDESVAALKNVLDKDISNILAAEQNVVDEHTQIILDAVNNLKIKPADYSKLDKTIGQIPADLSVYTEETVANLNSVLVGIDRNLDILSQNKVDEYENNVKTVIAQLKYKPADYSAVYAAISAIPYDLSIYTSQSVETLNDAVNSVEYDLNITQQSKVNEYAEKISDATENLKKESGFILFFRKIINFFKGLFGIK